MSDSIEPGKEVNRTAALLLRCKTLSLPCIRLEGSRAALIDFPALAPAQAFFASPAFAQLARAAVANRQSGAAGEPLPVFEGCWLLPLAAPWEPVRESVPLAVILTEPALRSAPFVAICASAGQAPAGVRESMGNWVHRESGGVERLTELLRWSCQDLEASHRHEELLRQFSDKLIQSYEETHVLFRIMRFMASTGSPHQQVQLVCNQIQQILPFRWVAVVFKNQERLEATLRGQIVLAGEPPVGEAEFRRELVALLDRQHADHWTRVLYPEENLLAAFVGAEVACDPITYNGNVVGVLLAGNKTGAEKAVASPEIQFIDAVADFLGTFHENAVRFSEQQQLFMGMLRGLTAAIDAKDPYTRGHSERVAFLSGAIALAMGQGEEAAERARVTGLVHDIGKIGVPEGILCKPGRLTEEEFEAVKRHPEIGHRILRDIDPLQDVLPGVLHHHERWDGRGYPHKLVGEQIPLIARVIGLADTFDAMSSTRSYRPAMPRENVIQEIERGAGTQFDPRVVQAFRAVNLAGYDELLARRPEEGGATLGMAA